MLFNYFRNKPLIDSAITLSISSVKPRYRRIMALVMTQCWFQHGIAAESAVNIAVSIAKKRFGSVPAGFINAVLRNILTKGRESFESKLSLSDKLSIPAPLWERWKARWGETITAEFCGLIKIPATFTFRAKKPLTAEELDIVQAHRIDSSELSTSYNFYAVNQPAALFKTDWLTTGKIYIQDPATAVMAELPELHGGESVLDVCAAPGGKLILLSERLINPGRIVAADKSARRHKLTHENLASHHINAEIVTASASDLLFPEGSFDIVLADVPCSNTGVFRRRPDALWRFSLDSLQDITGIQAKILHDAAKFVRRSGGQLIYSTCSIETEENELQLEIFCRNYADFTVKMMRTILPGTDHDGGFAALLRRR
jgi:16S rRNA (cytosine967-C5)-methyltransferase